MGLMDRIKKVTGTNENYDDAYEDDYYDGFDSYDEGAEDAGYDVPQQPQGGNMNGAMGGMNTASTGGISFSGVNGANIKMQVVRPRTYDSDTTTQIANYLLNKCTVILNLENTNRETSRRLIDFLSGVAYANEGQIKKVANCTYIITPYNVGIMGEDLLDELSNSGLY